MEYGFYRLVCACPEVKIAGCDCNADKIIQLLKKAEKDGADFVLFPELSVTGASCGDLFLQTALIQNAERTLVRLAQETSAIPLIYAVGAPVKFGSSLFNCTVFIHTGRILAAVPKIRIGANEKHGELRCFKSASILPPNAVIDLDSHTAVPFGTDILIHTRTCCGTEAEDVYIAAFIGEDIYNPQIHNPLPHIILNPSAEPFIIGSAKRKNRTLSALSERHTAVCACANAGSGESATDFVFRAYQGIFENGTSLCESDLKSGNTGADTQGYIVRDADIQLLENARFRRTAYNEDVSLPQQRSGRMNAGIGGRIIKALPFTSPAVKKETHIELKRDIPRLPFVPANEHDRAERCEEVRKIQAEALAQRLKNTGIKQAVIGLSGGLDSSLALLAAVDAFKRCGFPLTSIHAFSMPCFGTSARTKNNAQALAAVLGVSFSEIDIQNAVRSHLKDIGANEHVHDSVYENAQARERTQILMDSANKIGGFVIGTGDLSEAALGWATYNGDHISMYNVNASIPKTLARALVLYASAHAQDYCSASKKDKDAAVRLAAILEDIVSTPVSPELLPAANGTIAQKTEDILGPYELHDFFLYYVVRRGFPPRKILFLAHCAFSGEYTEEYLKEKLALFYRRFFANQFKRSCMNDGISVGTLSLSPRGSFAMPSDAQAELWLKELNG